jgi:hypothetical protein
LVIAGDVHPNPCPSVNSDSSFSSSRTTTLSELMKSSSCLFFHYNVKSLISKIDILEAELGIFDILAFTETWLNSNISYTETNIQSFHSLERKDRFENNYGGVILYVKENFHYKRKLDREPRILECIWIEIMPSHSKRIQFAVFYLHPNSDT